MFGVVDDTTTTKFTSRACAVHCTSLPVVVDKAVVVVLKFPNIAFKRRTDIASIEPELEHVWVEIPWRSRHSKMLLGVMYHSEHI